MTAGPLALVGSGEYLPVMQDLEGRLLAGRSPRYVQIPTAAAPEGEQALGRWIRLGHEQAARLGVEAVPVVVKDRADADDPALAAMVEGAGLVYLSGGSPSYLASTLRGTLVWKAVLDAWQAGAALAGCSAGAMALTGWAPYVREMHRAPEPGLGLLPHLSVIPHYDRMVQWQPQMPEAAREHLPAGGAVLGIDEDTALVRFADDWEVAGRQQVHVLRQDRTDSYSAGDVVPLGSVAS